MQEHNETSVLIRKMNKKIHNRIKKLAKKADVSQDKLYELAAVDFLTRKEEELTVARLKAESGIMEGL